MTTARLYLQKLLDEIAAGPFTVAKVCAQAGMHPSMVSRWKKSGIEPRISTLERLEEAHACMLAEREITHSALRI
jgi:transcriptional regulator with XRE-family HTH domain